MSLLRVLQEAAGSGLSPYEKPAWAMGEITDDEDDDEIDALIRRPPTGYERVASTIRKGKRHFTGNTVDVNDDSD